MTNDSDPQRKLIRYAPPPLATVVFVICVAAVSLKVVPTWDEIVEEATHEALGTSAHISSDVLGAFRVTCVVLMLFVVGGWILGDGHIETTSFLAGSKLVEGKVRVVGIKHLIFFTNWCFLLLLVSFLGMTVTSYARGSDDVAPPILRGITLLR